MVLGITPNTKFVYSLKALKTVGFTVLFLLAKRKNAVNLSFVKFH